MKEEEEHRVQKERRGKEKIEEGRLDIKKKVSEEVWAEMALKLPCEKSGIAEKKREAIFTQLV